MPKPARQGGWKQQLPPERAYRRRAGAVAPSVEQDRAAGGRHRRSVALSGGLVARASISLRLYRRTRRIRAYLRWSQDGKTQEKYVCEVEHATRAANLAEAWRQAWEKRMLVEERLPPESKASSIKVRATMRANRGKDTRPELALRRLLYQQGLRYRVDARPLAEVRRRADVVFSKERVAVFVDGCFWHGCPDHYRPSTKNAGFWREKIDGNRTRDAETNGKLLDAGWTVVRIWEHEDPAKAAEKIVRLLREARTAVGRTTAIAD